MSARMEAAMARLDEVLTAPVPTRAPSKQYLLIKAATIAATDRGTFDAVISASAVDREKDIVPADVMVKALRAWIGSGKMIPLAWMHGRTPDDVIGHVDPASVKAVDGEVIASGWIDQGTPAASRRGD